MCPRGITLPSAATLPAVLAGGVSGSLIVPGEAPAPLGLGQVLLTGVAQAP